MKIDELIRGKFRDKTFLESGEEILFNHADSLKVIDECEKQKWVILGLDFWKKKNHNLVEINSTNWKNINEGENASEKTINAARKLIMEELPDNADYVSFVIVD